MKKIERAPKPTPSPLQEEGVHLAPLLMLQTMINEDFERFLSRFAASAVVAPGKPYGSFNPGVNVMEKDNVVHIEAELPGLSQHDVTVAVENNVLTIQGERIQDAETKEYQMYRREFSYGSFRRSISLPGEVDAGKSQARFKRGILTVDLPLTTRKPTSSMTIPINDE